MKFRTFSQLEAEKAGIVAAPTSVTFSKQLRRQLVMIISETLGLYYTGTIGPGNDPVDTTHFWELADRVMYREVESYADYADGSRQYHLADRIRSFIMEGSDAGVREATHFFVSLIDRVVRPYQDTQSEYHLNYCEVKMKSAEALDEIDTRLREAGMVYRVADGTLIKSTDDFTHNAVIVPALQVLGESGFENALKEFHEALEAYRTGKFDVVLQKANHAFESAMKIVAGKMKWSYDPNATAKVMIDVMTANGLVPTMRDSALKSLATLLQSDLPTLRNKTPSAGHGAGEKDAVIPEPVATYALNVAAANIRLLVESYHLKRKRR